MVIRRSFDGIGIMLSDRCQQIFHRLKPQGQETQSTGKRDDNEDIWRSSKLAKREKPLVSSHLHKKRHEAGLMKKAIENQRESDRKITIHTKKHLDCSAHSSFMQACQSAERKDVQAIVVDLNATHDIRASGLGMLLMLHNETKALNVKISIENCNPEIKTQLDSSRLLAGLSVM